MNARTLPYILYAVIVAEAIAAIFWTLFHFNIFVLPIWVFAILSGYRLHRVAQRMLRIYGDG